MGERLGIDGDKIIKSDCNGKMIFPKYVAANSKQRPAELCRIMRKVEMSELETIREGD